MSNDETDIDRIVKEYRARHAAEEEADHAVPIIVYIVLAVAFALICVMTAAPFWLPKLVALWGGCICF